jgi:hypothetical protein
MMDIAGLCAGVCAGIWLSEKAVGAKDISK